MSRGESKTDLRYEPAKVAVAGCGNIGSHLIPLLVRMDEVGALLLVDPDRYKAKNLHGQNCLPSDVERAKAVVQAERARRINPAKRVDAVVDRFENLPLGDLRGALLISCLDSLAARLYVNRVAWRLGTAWVDAGVRADGLLARVTVYSPEDGQPCIECGLDDRQYENMDHISACSDAVAPAATNAPAALGALAAAMQAVEIGKLLSGRANEAAVGREVLVDMRGHHHYVTRLRRNPACRFDHATLRIAPAPATLTLGAALALGDGADTALSVEGDAFVPRLACRTCGEHRRIWRLRKRLRPDDSRCEGCGAALVVSGFDLVENLTSAAVPEAVLRRPLRDLGVDVFRITGAGREPAHYGLG